MVRLVMLTFSLATLLAWALSYAADRADLTEKDAAKIGIEASIYGCTLVTVAMTRRVMTNVAEPIGTHAPKASSLG